jgi:hypothetical protein
VERFFKDEIQSREWYTNELRKLARRFTRVIHGEEGLDYLVEVADNLFHGSILEEKVLAVLLRETVRFDGPRTIPLLMSIRAKAPRRVLRTACERLPAEDCARVLARE